MSRLVIVWIREYSLEHLPHILPKGGALVSVEDFGSKLVCLKFILPVETIQIDCQIDWQTADAAVDTTVGSLRIQDYKGMDDAQEDSVHSTEANLFYRGGEPLQGLANQIGAGVVAHLSHLGEFAFAFYQLEKLEWDELNQEIIGFI